MKHIILTLVILSLLGWTMFIIEANKVKPTIQPKYIDLPEEFDLATSSDTLVCFKRGDTLVVQFNNKY